MAQAQEVFLFSPTQISGCQVWLDGADPNGTGVLPANGASLSTWVDKSGLGNSFVALSAGTYNSTSNAVVFSNNYYRSSFPATPTNETAFLIFRFTNNNQPQVVVGANFGGREIALNNDGVSFGVINSQRAWGAIVGTITRNTTFLSMTQVSGGTNTYSALNGNLTITGPSSVPAFTSGVMTGLGRETENSIAFYGNLYEVLFYNSVLSASNRQQIEGYLAWKWGIQSSLPANHPYKTFRPIGSFPVVGIPPTPFRVQTALPFNPTQITGCQIWVDAADPASMTFSSGSNLQSWANKATASSVFTRGGTADRVVYTSSNGLPLVSFNSDGSTSNAWLTGPVSLTANTSFLQVITPISYSVGTWSFYWSWQWTNAGDRVPGLRSSNVNNDLQPYITWVGNNNNRIPITNGTSYLSFVEFTGGGANTRYSINGNTPTGGAIAASNANSSVFILGGDGNNGATVWGKNYLSEMIMYSNVLTTQQRQQLEGYLAWKWNLTASLPTGHPYKMTPYIQFPSRVISFNGSLNQWTPTQISGCSLWLDSADQTTFTFSGSNLTQWRDKSTTAAIFTGSTPAPVLSASRYGSNIPVSFGGSSYFQNTTFPYTTSSRSAFFVYDETTEQNNVGILSFASSGTDYSQSNTMVYETGFKVSSQYLQLVQNSQAIQFQTTTIGFALYSDTFSSNLESAYVNGSFVKATTFTGPFSNSTGLVIGARMLSGSIGNYLIGVIGEVVLFNRPLLTAERQQVEGYLAWKWGLVASLPANHPFKRWPPSP